MTTIRVRGREPADLEALTEIFNCPGVVAGTLQLPYQSVESRRERWGQQPPGSHSLVAEVDGRVVGSAGIQVQPADRRRHVGSIGMGVHDDFQGRGVGTALLAALLDLAFNWLGLQRIELTVYADNAAAVRLYQKFGFVIEGTARRYALRNGELVDAHHMALFRDRQ
ncbi:MAG TPA: GNAT family N-acetyltransferase [Thermomicrobiales bacterium]|nr:GNAT family N-acetyltransferase [Thermomicrobiales bacterium]